MATKRWKCTPVLQHPNVYRVLDKLSQKAWYIKRSSFHETNMFAHVQAYLGSSTCASPSVCVPPHCAVQSSTDRFTMPGERNTEKPEPLTEAAACGACPSPIPNVCVADILPGQVIDEWTSHAETSDGPCVFLVTVDMQQHGFFPATHRLRSEAHLLEVSRAMREFTLHSGVVHNDLSAANVHVKLPSSSTQVQAAGDRESAVRVCLIDFEMAVRSSEWDDWKQYHTEYYWKQRDSCLTQLRAPAEKLQYGICFDQNRLLTTCWRICGLTSMDLYDLLHDSMMLLMSDGDLLDDHWLAEFSRVLANWQGGRLDEQRRVCGAV